MQDNSVNWALVFIGLGSVVLELILGVSTGFDLLLIGLALILGGLTGLGFSSPTIGVVSSIVLIGLYVLIGRRLVKNRLKVLIDTRTNSDSLIGKSAIVVKLNQVKVGGEIWRSESDSPLEIGSTVKIISLEGTTLKVCPS